MKSNLKQLILIVSIVAVAIIAYKATFRVAVGGKHISQSTIDKNERIQFYSERILPAHSSGDVETELYWLKEACREFPENGSLNGRYGRRLAEEGLILESGQYLWQALNPANYSARISNGDAVLYYWYLKYGIAAQDQAAIDRATELLKTKRTRDVFRNDVTFVELKESGLTAEEIGQIYAAQASFGFSKEGVPYEMLKPVLEAHPENKVLDRVAAATLFVPGEEKEEYIRKVYDSSSAEKRQELMDLVDYAKYYHDSLPGN